MATAAILAGGSGRRLGGAKALAPFAGTTLVEHAAGLARGAGLEPLVVAKPDTALPALDSEVLIEPAEPRHPLAGIVAALEREREDIVVIACDMPLVPPELLRLLAGLGPGLAVCGGAGGIEPLLGRYPAAALPAFRAALAAESPLRRAVGDLSPRIVRAELAPFGDPELMLMNVNTPEDLERAGELLGVR